MGYGVFAKEVFFADDDLGEYLGELVPGAYFNNRNTDPSGVPWPDDDPGQYAIQLNNTCISNAKVYGNWTRFVK